MANRVVFFRQKKEMKAKFAEIIKTDTAMAKEKDFHELLLFFAGTLTNERQIVFVLEELAFPKLSDGVFPASLVDYLEALVDDKSTIKSVIYLMKNFFNSDTPKRQACLS